MKCNIRANVRTVFLRLNASFPSIFKLMFPVITFNFSSYTYYYYDTGAINMSEKMKQLFQQNPGKLEILMRTDTRQTGN